MLDVEVAGAVAPKAKIAVYFTPNTDAGFLNALKAAIHDSVREPSVVSISWGGPEKQWTAQAINAFNTACQEAASLGVTVCCSAGDHGAQDEQGQTRANVDFPASSPSVLACGGTSLIEANGQIASETVWNDHDGWATGGGISEQFPVPPYQAAINLPNSINPGGKKGRGVPDVAGNADGRTGYRVRVDGQNAVVGGTSAVAPLWSALIALLNQGKGHSVGFLTPKLYHLPAGAHVFRDITSGNNQAFPAGGGYSAGLGWDACTGLGSPNGAGLLAKL
jgi:kumamolisin